VPIRAVPVRAVPSAPEHRADRSFDPVEHVGEGRTVGTDEHVAEVSVHGVGSRDRRCRVGSVRERRRDADLGVVVDVVDVVAVAAADVTSDDWPTRDGGADIGARAGIDLCRR
jgi:hypothetical protein